MKPETPPVPSPPAATSGPLPAAPAEEAAPESVPEEILDEWRWIFKGRSEGLFDAYAGQHIAVCGQKVLASGRDPDLLREEVARAHHIDPERLVVAYIDRW